MLSSAGTGKVSWSDVSDNTSGSMLAHEIISEGMTSEWIAIERPKTRQKEVKAITNSYWYSSAYWYKGRPLVD